MEWQENTAVDNAGLSADTTVTGISIDEIPPSTTGSASVSSTQATVTLTASDAVSGVAETRYSVDGGAARATADGSASAFHAEIAIGCGPIIWPRWSIPRPVAARRTPCRDDQGPDQASLRGIHHREALDILGDQFHDKAAFELGGGSDSIDPVRETTTFTAWTHTTTLPPDCWRAKKTKYPAKWVFNGVVDGVSLKLKLAQVGPIAYEFRAVGSGASLAGQGYPVFVTLTVGDEAGTTEAKADFQTLED